METFIVLWLICGFITAVVASGKGRNGCAWFIGGALLGPLGIVLALVVQPSEQALINAQKVKRCPYCAELIRPEAIKCRHCGADLGPA